MIWEWHQRGLVKYKKLCHHALQMWTCRTYLAMAMALNCLIPSDTALATAFFSAQIPRFEHTFSTLQPVEDLGNL